MSITRLITLLTVVFTTPLASAHFQMIYTPYLLLDRGGQVEFRLAFTHPAQSGAVMNAGKPQDFYYVRRGEKTSLIEFLKPIQWTSSQGSGEAWESKVTLRNMGDYVFVLEPAPYYEAEEDIYIQQITKSVVNVASLPTDWNTELGLKTEIIPLTKPYAIYEGGIFTGVVKSAGKPVPFAEIEVEYINFAPDLKNNRFSTQPNIIPPANAFITMTLYSDANGTFHFGIPAAGQWGFAALDVGPDKEFNGKPMSQDAVIWVQAFPVQKSE